VLEPQHDPFVSFGGLRQRVVFAPEPRLRFGFGDEIVLGDEPRAELQQIAGAGAPAPGNKDR
jgi:hypothetical protein